MKSKSIMTALTSWLMFVGCTKGPEYKVPEEILIKRYNVSQEVYDALAMCKWETIYDCMEKYPYDANLLLDALWIRNTDDWQAMNLIKLYPITEEIYRSYEEDDRLDELSEIVKILLNEKWLIDELIKISHSDSYCPEKYCFQNNWKYPIIKNPYGEAFNIVNRLEKAKIPSRLWTKVSVKAWAMDLGMDSSL